MIGCLTSLLVTMKGLPMTYNRDMQEDKEPLFEAADQLAGSLEMARAVVESARARTRPRPAAAAEESWVVATDLAEALARAGTPFHQAHQMAGRLVLESVRAGRKPRDWTAEEMSRFAPEFTGGVGRRCSHPKKGMKSREIPGRHRAGQPWPRALAEARHRAAGHG